MVSKVVQWLALLSQSKKLLGSIPELIKGGLLCGISCSPCASISFLPQSKEMLIRCSKLPIGLNGCLVMDWFPTFCPKLRSAPATQNG